MSETTRQDKSIKGEQPVAAGQLNQHSFIVDLFIRIFREKPLGAAGAVIFAVLSLLAIFANIIAPYGYNDFSLAQRLAAPSMAHLMGTDHLGRDLFSRIVYGARVSMVVGLGTSIICATLASMIGIATGFLGGKLDVICQRFVDGFMCFPALFLYLTMMAVLGPGLLQVVLVLGVVLGIRQSRTVRGAVISIKQNVYVEAARAIGCPPVRIMARHILPNVVAPIIVIFTISMGQAIITEATLSFLGFGIPPPMPTWGGMLSEEGREYMFLGPWMAIWPGLALVFVVYGINMLGDAMRDILDPRLKGGLGRYGKTKKKRLVTSTINILY